MISPGTDVDGSSLPSTAHSISRASGTAASTTTLRSKARAVSIAGTSSSRVLTFEMPTLDPRFAGLTNTGKPQLVDLLQDRLAIAIPLPRARSRATRTPASRVRRTGPSLPPCPCPPLTRVRQARRTECSRAPAGLAPCRLRRTDREGRERPHRGSAPPASDRRRRGLRRSSPLARAC